ncbi:unnamed protein product [Echinostoma caproni]|uniref:Uncharacterized protein n=1 Tax=Echinostoma caproni TaxID=27848 RepID=A0A183BBX1_9TREM|nr:unnamed protein product [Echinostoma caproni]
MVLHDQVDHAVQFDVGPRIAIEKNNLFTQSQPCDVACRVLQYGAFLFKTSVGIKDFNQPGQVYCAMHWDPENNICLRTNTEQHASGIDDGTRRFSCLA